MKKHLLIIFLSMLTLVGFGQKLIVEFTTDGAPEETIWTLYNYNDDLVATRTFDKTETTYFDTVELDNAICYYITITDSYGDGLAGSSGFDPGNYKLYLDNQLIVSCEDPNFGFSISHYSIGAQCANNDAKAQAITLLDYISKDTTLIGVEILNMGNEPINSVELVYSTNSTNSSAATINNLNILPGKTKVVNHPTAYIFDTPGDINASINITKVNELADANSANNIASKTSTVLDGILLKNLIELSSTEYYGESVDANTIVDNTLKQFSGTYGHAKYMLDWGDTKYIPENEYRFDSVYQNGVPILWVNGKSERYQVFDPENYMANLSGNTSDFELSITPEFKGDSIFATVKLISLIDYDTAVYLRGIATQGSAKENIASRGGILHDAAYGYLPTPAGYKIEKMEAGKMYTFKTGINIKNYPLEDGSLDDMNLLFYLQMRKPFYNVLQTESVKLEYSEIKPVLNFNIDNNAQNIDTAGLQIELASNRTYYKASGEPISNLNDHVILRLDNENGSDVPYIASMNEQGNQIIIKNKYKWRAGKTYFVKVSNIGTLNKDAIADQTLTFTIKNVQTDISSYSPLNVNIYPNPATDFISIETNLEATVLIFDTTGNQVFALEKEAGRSIINTEQLEPGVFFVKVNTTQHTKTFKLIRK